MVVRRIRRGERSLLYLAVTVVSPRAWLSFLSQATADSGRIHRICLRFSRHVEAPAWREPLSRRRRSAKDDNAFALRKSGADLACVKTHTSAKCRKNNSPSRHRTCWCAVSSTLKYAIPPKCFYVCGECWSSKGDIPVMLARCPPPKRWGNRPASLWIAEN